jgi:hypothetical protein
MYGDVVLELEYHCLFKNDQIHVEGRYFVKVRIVRILLLETKNNLCLKSERESVWNIINLFVQKHTSCSAKSCDLTN